MKTVVKFHWRAENEVEVTSCWAQQSRHHWSIVLSPFDKRWELQWHCLWQQQQGHDVKRNWADDIALPSVLDRITQGNHGWTGWFNRLEIWRNRHEDEFHQYQSGNLDWIQQLGTKSKGDWIEASVKLWHCQATYVETSWSDHDSPRRKRQLTSRPEGCCPWDGRKSDQSRAHEEGNTITTHNSNKNRWIVRRERRRTAGGTRKSRRHCSYGLTAIVMSGPSGTWGTIWRSYTWLKRIGSNIGTKTSAKIGTRLARLRIEEQHMVHQHLASVTLNVELLEYWDKELVELENQEKWWGLELEQLQWRDIVEWRCCLKGFSTEDLTQKCFVAKLIEPKQHCNISSM